MSGGPTYCDECEHVLRGKNDPPWSWLCLEHPLIEGMGFVMRGLWSKQAPYLRCRDVNGGACKLFKKAAPGQMKLMEASSGND